MSWSSIADMPTARYALAATSDANGNIYVIGGNDTNFNKVATVEKWDGSSWSSLPDMPTARELLAVASDSGGNIYAMGGENSSGEMATVEKWDGSSWSSLPDMPTVRYFVAGTSNSSGIYAIGGYNGNVLATVETFAISTPSPPDPPSNLVATQQ